MMLHITIDNQCNNVTCYTKQKIKKVKLKKKKMKKSKKCNMLHIGVDYQ